MATLECNNESGVRSHTKVLNLMGIADLQSTSKSNNKHTMMNCLMRWRAGKNMDMDMDADADMDMDADVDLIADVDMNVDVDTDVDVEAGA